MIPITVVLMGVEWTDLQEGYKRIQGALKDGEGSGHRKTIQAEERVWPRKCGGEFRKEWFGLRTGRIILICI